jgi:hypothetical protein
MSRKNFENVTYSSRIDDGTEVFVNYNPNNTLSIYVVPPVNKVDDYSYYRTYLIKLTSKTRNLPEFKRFNNDVRARIGTGIYICSYTPGFNLPLDLAQDSYPNPWYLQRRMVSST